MKLSDISDGLLSLAKVTHPMNGLKLQEWHARLYKFYELDYSSSPLIHDLTFDQQIDLWSKLVATQGNRLLKIVERREEFVKADLARDEKGPF
jgi:hypothetical protein